MTFYNNRAAIAHIDEEEVYLFRNIDSQIVMDHYTYNGEGTQDIILEDAMGEFDIQFGRDDEIYLIYQNIERNLCILTIDKEIKDQTYLSEGGMSKVFELNVFRTAGNINIIYLTLQSERDGIFHIHHHMLKDNRWISYLVEEIRIDKVLNPIRILEDEENILLFYYYDNQICLKKFDMENMKWKESIILGDNKEKLYIDVIKDDIYIHIAYSEYNNENLRIKYMRYIYNDDFFIKEKEEILSNEGNPSNPTIIMEDSTIWVVWNESSNLFSSYSLDNGDSWSSIYLWNESKSNNMVRYKYITNIVDRHVKFDYTFGSIYPDVKFLGFGPLNNVEEIIPKKKLRESLFQI
ncbi:hypothetical protein ACTNDY_08255 [Tissierellaceae bacterium HCP3S3_D8]